MSSSDHDLPRADRLQTPPSPAGRRTIGSPRPRPQSFFGSAQFEFGRRGSATDEDVEAISARLDRRRSVILEPLHSPAVSTASSSSRSSDLALPGAFSHNATNRQTSARPSTGRQSTWTTFFLAPVDARGLPPAAPTSESDLATKTARIKSQLIDLPRQADSPGHGSGREWHALRNGQRRAPSGSDLETTSALVYDPAVEDYHAVLRTIMAEARDGRPALLDDTKAIKRVLDVGCGTSAGWILQAAQQWPDAQFTGLDAAPNLVDKSQLPTELASRLSFVQCDFLGPWPFVRLTLELTHSHRKMMRSISFA